jgi:two-component system nitrogen regulation sensor histidine kinase NtrY
MLLLLFLVARILLKNYIEKKRGMWGSRLKIKLTMTLLLISIVPSFTLFLVTTAFFEGSMEKWFGDKIEQTIDDAIGLSQIYYEELFQRYEETGKEIAREMERQDVLSKGGEAARFLAEAEKTSMAGYLAVFDALGGLIAKTGKLSEEAEKRLSTRARDFRAAGQLRVLMPLDAGELVASGTRIADAEGYPAAMLFVGNATRFEGIKKLRVIGSSYREFKESRPLKKILKYSFIIPLSLVTILTIFFSVWVGYKFAAEITVPIERVREGAAIIAKGNFDVNLEDRGKDEINTLVQAFNSMARELQLTKNEMEERRRYMEIILNNVSTGIISSDKRGNILLMNKAAQAILQAREDDWIGQQLTDVLPEGLKKYIRPFLREVIQATDNTIINDIKLNLTKDITDVRASLTILKDADNRTEGFIITFDDITHLVRAEKLATWREVARKLTHEIKNPLTPILLSAERIRRRMLGRPAPPQGQQDRLLDETTSVIVRSVEDIKNIVNDLNRLTHVSQLKAEEDMNAIVEEAVDIYRNLYGNITVTLEQEQVPPCTVDREGMKRTLTNLIQNAVKAIDGDSGTIAVATRYDAARSMAVIEVADTGKGIPDDVKSRIFDPYFTRDQDGMGLGLAIVNSIITEHQGRITVADNAPRGTRFTIEIPVSETSNV